MDAATIGLEARVKLESRLRLLEQGIGHTSLRSLAKSHDAKAGNQKKFEMSGNGASYNDAADTLLPTAVAVAVVKMEVDDEDDKKKVKKEKKRRAAELAAEEEAGAADESVVIEGESVRGYPFLHSLSLSHESPLMLSISITTGRGEEGA